MRQRTWPLIILAAPAFVAVWSGWVGLGKLTGFGVVHPLPGIWDGLEIDTSITLPIGVETYACYALSIWLSGDGSARTRSFAKISAIVSLILGASGQITYHLLAAPAGAAPWQITVVVSTLPVAVLGMGSALKHLASSDVQRPAVLDVQPKTTVQPSTLDVQPKTTVLDVQPKTTVQVDDRPDVQPSSRPALVVRTQWEASGRTMSDADIATALGIGIEAARGRRRRWAAN